MTLVSRGFYAATRLSGLYVHHSICVDRKKQEYAVFGTITFMSIVDHAAHFDRLLSLDIYYHNDRGEEAFTASDMPRDIWNALAALVALLPHALEKLVRLFITVPQTLVPSMLDALREPAPLLNTFCFKSDQGWWHLPATYTLPQDLFGGRLHAGNLRTVSLSGVGLGQVPLPAFARISHVHLEFGGAFSLNLGQHFPAASHLEFRRDGYAQGARPLHLGFIGLSVQRLAVEDAADPPHLLLAAISEGLQLHAVPEVQIHNDDNGDSAELLWPTSPGPLAVRLEDGIAIVVSSLISTWKRILHFDSYDPEGIILPSRLGGLPILGHVTYLRLENAFVDGLLRAQLDLEALERLHVDVRAPGALWPPAWKTGAAQPDTLPEAFCFVVDYPDHFLRCPRLETLTLLAPDGPLVVHSREAAYLGCALGQEHRDCTLALVGVSFSEPVSWDLLKQMFSVVTSDGFERGDAQEDQDSGLWDYDWSTVW
ncbi:hypothetical protein AURDEDRAFT_163730 [Auricularia subglabra TFB-10046 SS5]|nr:hypothetical protein AURDEDRAFT_163730 [Auricularia subglabra TFB-10046 SS5]